MLKPELDLEVIKSALLAGEVDDAVDWITRATRGIEVYRRVTKSTKYDARYRFLDSLMKYLGGEITMEELKKGVEKIPEVRSIFVPTDEFGGLMNSFLYYVGLAVDRYNIRYPAFDGKRCDDK